MDAPNGRDANAQNKGGNSPECYFGKKTWLGVGGPAEFYFEPADEKDLARFIKNRPAMPMTVLGGGSNVLIRENGIPGIVIHLGKSFTNYTIKEDIISCDAGLLTIDLSKIAQKTAYPGLNFYPAFRDRSAGLYG